ncbi:hypothetical protein Tco_1112071 [Tanacetum coccineum]|uniref:Uncharacterized protein n=1 Tax=Tanacetum coccineum TaxID=301880 RepID=A0ABQ5INH3_9ASTR
MLCHFILSFLLFKSSNSHTSLPPSPSSSSSSSSSMSCSNYHSNFSRKPRIFVRQVGKCKISITKSSPSSQKDPPPLPQRVYLQSPSPPSYNPLRDQMINQFHNISTILDSHTNPSNAYIHAPPSPPPQPIHPPSHTQVEFHSSFCHCFGESVPTSLFYWIFGDYYGLYYSFDTILHGIRALGIQQTEVKIWSRDSSLKPTTGCDKESENSKENTDDSLKQHQKTDTETSSVKSSLKVDKDWKEKFFYPANHVSKVEPKKVRKNNDASIIEDWVSDDEEQDGSKTKPEKKTVIPTAAKIENLVRKQ